MDYEKKYKEAFGFIENVYRCSNDPEEKKRIEEIFPELKEREDILKGLISMCQTLGKAEWIAWLEAQGEMHLENYDKAEKEKADFVGDGFIECHANFLDFKEGNTYWLEYIGDDKYNVRSDNLLGKTYHITPCQLYTIFKKQTWLEKQAEQKHTAEEVLIKAGLKPYKDGDQWCVLLGDNIQEGICGFGNTIEDALYAFLKDLIASQSEQKPADKVEPKFHEGDFVINSHGFIMKIVGTVEQSYQYIVIDNNEEKTLNCSFSKMEESCRLWDITKDAKDGDVLVCNEEILLFKSYSIQGHISLYCWYNGQTNNFHSKEVADTLLTTRNKIYPATKEQRDLLFQKMKEAGYEWDADKKELRKIEQKPAMIQWKGDNLKEVVDFTGVYKEGFEKWFHNSWEEYEKYVHEHNNIFKIFNEDGSHMEIPVGAWIIKAPDGYITASRFGVSPILTELSIESNFKFKKAIEAIENYVNSFPHSQRPEIWQHINFLKSFRERVQPQPKQEWSEVDEDMLYKAISVFNKLCAKREEFVWSAETLNKIFWWLKSLKDRVQPQQKQSLDEDTQQWVDAMIKDYEGWLDTDKNHKATIEAKISILKSLRPQKRWKPSDEQIKVCKEVYADILSAKGFDLGTINSELNRLEEELKKLKG